MKMAACSRSCILFTALLAMLIGSVQGAMEESEVQVSVLKKNLRGARKLRDSRDSRESQDIKDSSMVAESHEEEDYWMSHANDGDLLPVRYALPGDRDVTAELPVIKTRQQPPHSRVVGGSQVDQGRFSYLVSLGWKNAHTGRVAHKCGGVLLSANVIITAAHCEAHINYITIGDHNIKSRVDDGKHVERYYIEEFIAHGSYDPQTFDFDVALVFFGDYRDESPRVRSGAVAVKEGAVWDLLNNNSTIPTNGDVLEVIGWGVDRVGGLSKAVPYAAQVFARSDSDCEGVFSSDYFLEDTMVCASANGKDACQGDSGGPLVLKGAESEHDRIVGLVSW
jgi:trypsin